MCELAEKQGVMVFSLFSCLPYHTVAGRHKRFTEVESSNEATLAFIHCDQYLLEQ